MQIVEAKDDLEQPEIENPIPVSQMATEDTDDAVNENDIPVPVAKMTAEHMDYEDMTDEHTGGYVCDEIHKEEENVNSLGESCTVNEIDKQETKGVGETCDVVPKTSRNPILDKDHIQSEVESIKSKVGDIEKGVGDVHVSHLLCELEIVKKRIGVVENVLGIKFEETLVVNDDMSVDDDVHNMVTRCNLIFFN